MRRPTAQCTGSVTTLRHLLKEQRALTHGSEHNGDLLVQGNLPLPCAMHDKESGRVIYFLLEMQLNTNHFQPIAHLYLAWDTMPT